MSLKFRWLPKEILPCTGSHQWDEKINDIMTHEAIPVHVNLYTLTGQWARQLAESWPKHGQFPANRSSLAQWQYPVCTAMVLSAQSRTGCRQTPLSAPSSGEVGSWKHCECRAGKEKTFYSGNKLLSCSAAICSDGTKGKEGYVPVSVMLMWIINHHKDWGEAVDLYPHSFFQKLASK